MDPRMFEASYKGDVEALLLLLGEDRLILYTLTMASSETPLHIAALLGHTEFARVVIGLNSKLAGEFNRHRVTPLHIASSQGYLEIVEDLLEVDSGYCLLRDSGGRTPLHCAAEKGRLNVLPVLLSCCPASALERTWSGETVLHLAVKNSNLEALVYFVHYFRNLGPDDAFMNSKDKEGDTILHIATAEKQLQIVEFLVTEIKVDVNAVNSKGLTVLDVLLTRPAEPDEDKIVELLQNAGGQQANLYPSQGQVNNPPSPVPSQQLELRVSPPRTPLRKFHRKLSNSSSGSRENNNSKGRSGSYVKGDWSRNGIIILCVMFATLAFEVALNPPGGLWQEWDSEPITNSTIPGFTSNSTIPQHRSYLKKLKHNFKYLFPKNTMPVLFLIPHASKLPNVTASNQHRPGKAVARELAKKEFFHFLFSDSMCFFTSLITIWLALGRVDTKDSLFNIMVTMVLVSAAALYMTGIQLVTDNDVPLWLFLSTFWNLVIIICIFGILMCC